MEEEGRGDLLLMMAPADGELELGGELVGVDEGVSEMVLVEDGTAVVDLVDVGVIVMVRVLLTAGVIELD